MKTIPAPATLLLPLLFAASPTLAWQDATPLSLGSPVRGEITSRDRINYNDGSRSVAYAIDLEAGQAVSFEVSGAPCTRLLVLHDGARVAGPSRPKCSDDSAPAVSRLSLLAAEPGRYLLAVNGADQRAFGPFRLEARALEIHRGDAPLQPGARIVDLLRQGARTYQLDIRQTGYYTIDLRSSEFDAALELEGNGLAIGDDDGGEDLDSRLRVPLEPGRYTLHAKAVDDNAAGLFELSVSTNTLPVGVRLVNGGDLGTDGTAITGALAGAAREYSLRLARPSRVTIDLSSEDFDTVLELHGNDQSRENDDGPDGTNSRIAAVLQPGTYRVVARGLAGHAAGLFRLSAKAQPFDVGGLRNGGTLEPGSTITGLYEGEARRYELVVPEAGELVIDLTSDEFDTVLELLRDGRSVEENDDGGDRSNARITRHVEPGTYTVIARGFGEANHGLFELRSRLRP